MGNAPSRTSRTASVASFDASDFVQALALRNPKLPPAHIELAGQTAAALSDAAISLAPEQQRRLLAYQTYLPELLAAGLEQLAARLGQVTARARIVPVGPVEVSAGPGLGARIERSEGLRRLSAFATDRPLESWAGPIAGAGELEQKYGIARSTLNGWRLRGAIVGLLRGERKHVYPEEQFIDGRPLEGLAGVQRIVGDTRTAWLWLRQPQATFTDARPLDWLRLGRVDDVVEAARRDFA